MRNIPKKRPVQFAKFGLSGVDFLQVAKVLALSLLAILFAGPGSRSVSTLRATSPTRLPGESSDGFLHAEFVVGANLDGAGHDASRQIETSSAGGVAETLHPAEVARWRTGAQW